MSKKLRTKGYKWLSILIICSMILQIAPVSVLSTVFAEEKSTERVKKVSKEQVNQNARQEVMSKRTENSKTFLNADGTFTTEISQKPIHYKKNNSNTWQTINNELIVNKAEQVYENKANAFKVKFDQKHIPDTSFWELEDEQGSIQMQLVSLEHTDEMPSIVEGVIDGQSITYPDVFSNVDIKYTIGADRVKEDIIYTEQPIDGFPNHFTYKMDLEGMTVKESGGTVYLYDGNSGEPLYYFDAPYMYDSYIPEGFIASKGIQSIPEEAVSYDVQLTHEVINDQLYLHVIPNKNWLEDANRMYPITIDPTIVHFQSSNFVEDTSLRSAYPVQTGGNDTELGGGTASGNTLRSLLKFDFSSIPSDTTILSSSLDLWFSSTNGSTPTNLSVYKATKQWVENQASWNYAQTAPSTAWTTPGGDYESTKLATVSGITSPTSLDNELKKWEISTSIVQGWKDNPNTNYGLLLKSDTESSNVYKKFISSEHTVDSKYHPLLVVTYKTNARLGVEDYWLYDSHSLIGGNSYSNLTTANNVVQYTDFSLPGRGGFGLDFTRTYNSKSRESSVMGYGWTFTGNEKLYLNIKGTANILNYQDADGTNHEFTYDGPTATYYSGPAKYLTITKSPTDSSVYILQDKYGHKKTFKILQTSSDTNVKVAYIQSNEDLHGNRINYVYGGNNRITHITSDLGNGLFKAIELTYNPEGYVKTAAYDGSIFTFEYDANGRVVKVDQLKDSSTSTKTNFQYTDGLLSTIIDPNKRKTDYTYENGYLTKVQEPNINQTLDTTDRPGTEYSLDTLNKIAIVTDPEGNETTYYTNNNYVATRIVAGGIDTQYELDANYNITKETIDGTITRNTYDSKGNLLTTEDSNGNIQTYTYTSFGNVKTHTDSTQKTTTYTYNTKGDLLTIEIPDSNAVGGELETTFTYNSYGDLQSVLHPDKSSQSFIVDYTSLIRTIKNTDSFGNETTTKSDLKGNVLESKDGKYQAYYYTYNSKNELVQVRDPKLKDTFISYDDNGNIASIRNSRDAKMNFVYNGQNQLKTETNAIEETINYSYDNNGNLIDILLPNSGTIHSVYDELNRLTEVYSNDELKWKYNFEGDMLASINKGTSLYKSMVYYDNDYLKSIHEGSNSLEYTYSGNENISHVKYTVGTPTPTVLYYDLDDVNRMEKIRKNDGLVASFQYSQDGLPAAISYENGSSLSMQYDRSRLASYTMKTTTSQVFDTYTFEYDANQMIQKIISNAGITEYNYDELNQLKTEKLPNGKIYTYAYDEAGNRTEKGITSAGVLTSTAYAYNAANQLIKVGNQDYQYDENGNLTSDGTKTYVFNDFNQLEEIKDASGQPIASYTYDEEGIRKSTTTSVGTVHYYYDGDKVLYETDDNNQLLREYTYDTTGSPLTMTMNGETYYYLVNHHGDVMALTDTNRNVVASYTYDAWGNILTQTGPLASDNPYRYAGYRYDENTKFYYLLARYYNPDNGVFFSIDPVRGVLQNPITLNGYNYANNNPVMLVDPNGKSAAAIFGGGLAIPGIGWVSAGTLIAVVGSAWLIAKYGIPWAKNKYKNWYFVSKNIKGWDVRVEEHYGKVHAHWKKGGKKGSVNKDGSAHHKGESTSPPKEIKNFLKQRGFKVK